VVTIGKNISSQNLSDIKFEKNKKVQEENESNYFKAFVDSHLPTLINY